MYYDTTGGTSLFFSVQTFHCTINSTITRLFEEKKLNASRPPEHPPVRGGGITVEVLVG